MLLLAGCASREISQANESDQPNHAIPSGEIYIVPPGEEAEEVEIESSGVGAPHFELADSNPVLSPGDEDAWDRAGVHPGVVVFHDGLYHMFYNGHPERGYFDVGYAVSIDGLTWNRLRDEPVLRREDVDASMTGLTASSILVEPDGTWVMFVSMWNLDVYGQILRTAIYRATAPEPMGPWSSDGEKLLEPGMTGDWDSDWIAHPEVVYTGNSYRMYFTGVNNRGESGIGLALSEDGLVWEKYNDPETNNRSKVNSDPILQTADEDAWDEAGVRYPQVIWNGDRWVMMYIGLEYSGPVRWTPRLGFATSLDGIQWERWQANPIFDLELSLPRYDIIGVEWISIDGEDLLFFNNSDDLVTTEIYVAITVEDSE